MKICMDHGMSKSRDEKSILHDRGSVRWGMVVDLRKCVGCATCRDICARLHENLWAYSWRRVICVNNGCRESNSGNERTYLTMSCMQCGNPLCLEACPTGATYARSDGIIDIRKDLCIGCGACIVACPYRARWICTEDEVSDNETFGKSKEAESRQDYIGVCTKCNFCIDLIEEGKTKGLKPGIDPEATPLCVRFCIAEALYFGDLSDQESTVSQLIRDNKTTRLLEEMDTDPKIYYIL